MGVIDALGVGYRIVARRPYLIAIPVLVDLIIWLLPPISILEAISAPVDSESLAAQPQNFAPFSQISWLLALFLPASGLSGANTDTGVTPIELTSFGSILGAVVLLVAGGAILASAYLVLLANAIEGRKEGFELMPIFADKSPKFLGLIMGASIAMTVVSAGLVLLAVWLAAAAPSLPAVVVLLLSLVLFMTFIAFLTAMLAASLVMYFAILALILEPISIRDSIRRSLSFWRGNLGPAIVFVLLVTLVQIALGVRMVRSVPGNPGVDRFRIRQRVYRHGDLCRRHGFLHKPTVSTGTHCK